MNENFTIKRKKQMLLSLVKYSMKCEIYKGKFSKSKIHSKPSSLVTVTNKSYLSNKSS